MIKKRNKEKSFTLPEVMITIAVFLILLSIAILNYRTARQQLLLDRAAYKLAQDLRRAEEMAMSAQETVCSEGSVYRYGMFFKQNEQQYVLIADCNQNDHCDEGIDKVIETINLGNDIKIKEVPQYPLCIIFVPPDPTIYIKPALNEAYIEIALVANPEKTRRVIINRGGLIDVQ